MSTTAPGSTPSVESMSGRSAPTVVVVEDDPSIAGLVTTTLSNDGQQVYSCGTAAEGLVAIAEHKPDIVLLDLGLPDLDGTEVLRRLRADPATRSIGIICVTARADEIDRVLGFELGADDYVVKPFSPRELVGRVRALARRLSNLNTGESAQTLSSLQVDDLTIDFGRREVRADGHPLGLTPMERGLVEYLAVNRGLALSRMQILEAVWGHDWLGGSRTVDMHVAQIRRKIGDAARITTIRGIGYRLE